MSRFVDLNDKEIDELIENKDSKSTKRAINNAKKLFLEYALTKGKTEEDVEKMTAVDLDNLLYGFYPSIRKTDGDHMKLNYLRAIRYGVASYLKTLGMDIYTPDFERSKKSFDASSTQLKKQGKGGVDHKLPLSKEDMKKLYTSKHTFDTSTPIGLQNKVFFEIMLHICRRGRENLRQMTKQTFIVKKDGSAKKYVTQQFDELDKNHRADSHPDDTTGEGRMYETGGPLCPVHSFEKYVSKLSDIDALWQRPLDSYYEGDDTWYCRSPIGVNTLNRFMAKISKMADLSRSYTNHCIRSTCITVLDDAGIEARHIMRITGHKNESSIHSYSNRLSEQKKRSISNIISETVMPSTSLEPPHKKRAVDEIEEFDDETDQMLSQMILPNADSATVNVNSNTRAPSMQFNNCQVNINIHK